MHSTKYNTMETATQSVFQVYTYHIAAAKDFITSYHRSLIKLPKKYNPWSKKQQKIYIYTCDYHLLVNVVPHDFLGELYVAGCFGLLFRGPGGGEGKRPVEFVLHDGLTLGAH